MSEQADDAKREQVDDEELDDSLPPGSNHRKDGKPGEVREAAPYDDAPAQGKFAPDADNPAP